MKNTKPIIIGFLLFVALVGAGVWYLLHPGSLSILGNHHETKHGLEQPFSYTLDSLAIIDTALIGYTQKSTIPIDGEFPRAITCSNNRIFVSSDSSIDIFDTAGNAIHSITLRHSAQTLAIDLDGNLWSACKNKVYIFSPQYTLRDSLSFGGERSYLTSLAFDEQSVFSADAGMKIVWRYSYDGLLLGKIGVRDTAKGILGFVIPSPYMDIAMGRDGSLWVVNSGRHRIENYRPNGEFLGFWGKSGTAIERFCGCCGPIQMAILPHGDFVTAEKGIARIKVYNPMGTFQTVVAAPDALSPHEINLDIAIDSHRNILVLDSHAKKVRIFQKKG